MGSSPFKVRLVVEGLPDRRELLAEADAYRKLLAARLLARARRVAARARSLMPRAAGVAANAIVVVELPDDGGALVELLPGPVKAHAPNHMYYPAVIEYGGEGRPPIAPMGRALAAEADHL